jgi:putative Mg2+ transporter-C (MgtC) family protein
MADGLTVVSADLIRLLLAFVIGGLIGAEREFSNTAAGLRTMILICVGSAMFTIFSVKLAGDADPTRIAAQIVTGVGFLGAGVILHQGREVRGLTTASTIWMAAALGMGIGGGYLLFSIISAGVVLMVLGVLPTFEKRIERSSGARRYKVICSLDQDRVGQLQALFRGHRLKAELLAQEKRGSQLIYTWNLSGPAEGHQEVVTALLADPEVQEFQC